MASITIIQRTLTGKDKEHFCSSSAFDLLIENGEDSVNIELIVVDKERVRSMVSILHSVLEEVAGEVDWKGLIVG